MRMYTRLRYLKSLKDIVIKLLDVVKRTFHTQCIMAVYKFLLLDGKRSLSEWSELTNVFSAAIATILWLRWCRCLLFCCFFSLPTSRRLGEKMYNAKVKNAPARQILWENLSRSQVIWWRFLLRFVSMFCFSFNIYTLSFIFFDWNRSKFVISFILKTHFLSIPPLARVSKRNSCFFSSIFFRVAGDERTSSGVVKYSRTNKSLIWLAKISSRSFQMNSVSAVTESSQSLPQRTPLSSVCSFEFLLDYKNIFHSNWTSAQFWLLKIPRKKKRYVMATIIFHSIQQKQS